MILILYDRIKYEVKQLDSFYIVERQNLEKIMKEQTLQLSGATDSMVEIGKILNIKFVLTGSFGKLDQTSYYISLKLINVETAEVQTNYFIVESSFKNFVVSAPKTCLSRLLKLEKTPKTTTLVKDIKTTGRQQITELCNEKSKKIQKLFVPCTFCSGKGTIHKKLGNSDVIIQCSYCKGFKYSGPETGYKLIAGAFLDQ